MFLGIIADGNRRWAKKNNLTTAQGHNAGFRVISDIVLPACTNHKNITGLVVYAFSTENWKRDIFEINNLFSLFSKMTKEWQQKCQDENIKVTWAGRRDRVPQFLKNELEQLEKTTENNTAFTVFLCIDYGSHDEIKRAIAKGGSHFEEYLEVPMLDCIIRTGGEKRLSGFCLWQAEYAEMIFVPEFLPELTTVRFEELMDEWEKRERRKGG